ncbi:hypothetical protein ACSBR1_012480 [Camellia fascicularis]
MIGVGKIKQYTNILDKPLSKGKQEEAHKFLQPADKILKTLAVELAEYQVCVDVFITTQSYVDIASISVIPRTTGGQVFIIDYLFFESFHLSSELIVAVLSQELLICC